MNPACRCLGPKPGISHNASYQSTVQQTGQAVPSAPTVEGAAKCFTRKTFMCDRLPFTSKVLIKYDKHVRLRCSATSQLGLKNQSWTYIVVIVVEIPALPKLRKPRDQPNQANAHCYSKISHSDSATLEIKLIPKMGYYIRKRKLAAVSFSVYTGTTRFVDNLRAKTRQ